MKTFLAAAAGFARVLGAAAAIIAVAAPSAQAAKEIDQSCNPAIMIHSVPYFTTSMSKADSTGLRYVHKDDPRIKAEFRTAHLDPLNGTTRTLFVEQLQERGNKFAAQMRAAGGWAIPSVFPFDPVAYRVTYVNPAVSSDTLTGHMEVHLAKDCVLMADFSAPASLSFRSRWSSLVGAMDDLRVSTAGAGVGLKFAPEPMNPTGMHAFMIGLVIPAFFGGVLALVLSRVFRETPPGVVGRSALTVSAIAASVALGSHAAGFGGIILGAETAVLLACTGMLTILGISSTKNAISLASMAFSVVSGITVAAYSMVGWAGSLYLPLLTALMMIGSGTVAATTWGRS